MSQTGGSSDPRNLLCREMGFWDVLFFNIATVLGPRWIAAAAHNGTSSISLWVLAAALFFVPMTLVINELSSRFPEEGGLYVWSKEAFGDFHGFVAGWAYWTYTIFYFPGLLLASTAMSAYVMGGKGAELAQDRMFLLIGSLVLLLVAVLLNIIGLNIGKWLQNAGGVSTYTPLLILVGIAIVLYMKHGSVTHFTWANMMPTWNWDTVNFWSQIAFAFTGLELVSAMSGEIRDPRRTLPRAALTAAVLIAAMYIAGTFSLLSLVPAAEADPKSAVFHAITIGSVALKIGFVGVLAALLVTVGNAGGVGSTVAGIARVPFVVGIDRYLPKAFGKIHPKWRTPYISILVQAILSAAVLLLSQINETTRGAYQVVVDITIILYFIPFLYMFAAAIKLANRPDRKTNPQAVLVPGGKAGVWIACGVAMSVTLLSIIVSVFPPGDSSNRTLFVIKVTGTTIAAIAIGLVLYFRGARGREG
ncbi:MAG: amino acid permease [Acidobacteria bacterium]|nr:amino acid permease [Acidobacteriota bacterium]MBS1867848.1 amino acid permease [Acidobacteriota bacterium]